MTLVLCPECRAEVSDRAGKCPRCGYPLAVGPTPPVPTAEPEPPRIRTYISRRFAVAWTVATGATVVFMLALGRGVLDLEAVATVGALALFASSIPIWWKTRRSTRPGTAPVPAELERVEERLQAAEEEIRHSLGEMEDGTRRMMELEERIDFAERLLTKYRNDELLNP